MISFLFCAYMGFGLGMAMENVSKNDVYYKGFLIYKDPRELNQIEYTMFVIGYVFFWPASFWIPVKRAFMLVNKETGNDHPM